MLSALRRQLGHSELFSFNLVMRDRFIAQQAATIPKGAKVLDVGAGSCPYRPLFNHCEYRTQDLAQLKGDQIRYGGYGQIDYVCDASEIPVSDGSFDAVLCTEVLEHHPEPIRVVTEFGRILAPGGKLILTAPLGSGIHQEPYHFYGGYTPYWYHRFLSAAGFGKIEITPNEGSLRFFAQESIRFIRSTRPFSQNMPWLAEILWTPFWLCSVPVLGIVVPISAKLMDRFDSERRFTVGYHVVAIRD